MDDNTVYIIDLYNKYSSDKIISIFKINGRWWAIKEVQLQWGKPILEKVEEDNIPYYIYNTLEDAQQFVKQIKSLEGTK